MNGRLPMGMVSQSLEDQKANRFVDRCFYDEFRDNPVDSQAIVLSPKVALAAVKKFLKKGAPSKDNGYDRLIKLYNTKVVKEALLSAIRENIDDLKSDLTRGELTERSNFLIYLFCSNRRIGGVKKMGETDSSRQLLAIIDPSPESREGCHEASVDRSKNIPMARLK